MTPAPEHHRPDPVTSHLSVALDIDGSLDVEALRAALGALTAHQASLRMRPEGDRGKAEPAADVLVIVDDLRPLSAHERAEEVERRVLEEAARPFEPEEVPLCRACVLLLAEERSVLLLTAHRATLPDTTSVGDLATLYNAARRGDALTSLAGQYADCAAWQRERLGSEVYDKQIAYWKERLDEAPPRLDLMTDHARPAVRRCAGGSFPLRLGRDVTERLMELSRRQGASPLVTLMAVFQLLMGRYADVKDVSVGTPVTGRAPCATGGLADGFANTVVLRTRWEDEPDFADFLSRVREGVSEAYEHQDVPFEQVVAALRPPLDAGRTPLFQVMLGVRDTPECTHAFDGLSVTVRRAPGQVAEYDLTVMWDGGPRETGELHGSVVYDVDLFDRETVERMMRHYVTLLGSALAAPGTPVSQLAMSGVEDLGPISEASIGRPRQRARTLHELFSAAAARWPGRTALRQAGRSLTYAELDERSDAVCVHLMARGLRPGDTVVVWMDRGLAWPVALLGILKAGAAYVPVDVRHPRERIEYVLGDAQAAFVLGSRASGAPPSDRVPFVAVEDAFGADTSGSGARPGHDRSALAYILYTSGTTGRPKGVCVTHGNLVHTLTVVAECYELAPDDRVLQFSALTFDVAAEELFATLIRGATVVLRDAGPAPDIGELISLVQREGISVVNLPASYWHEWVSALSVHPPSSCPELRLVIVGSEPVDGGKLATWQASAPANLRWLNAYGPTETTITATVHEPLAHSLGQTSAATVPIGRPLAGVRAYVLDATLRPVPPGVPGELYIAGAGVSAGYLNDPARTAASFPPDPWGRPGDRMFATRDRVRRTAAGVLEFLGRNDGRIKLRGFRIEPAEIEHVLRLHPRVADAVVVLREDRPGDRRLVGYATVRAGEDAGNLVAELRSLARARLPEHMVPVNLVVLDALPLTSNGKIDRQALPRPEARAEIQGEALAARTLTEHRLSAMWSDVLGTPEVGVEDDFFRLGGHSLLAAQVMTRVREEFKADIPLRTLFDRPTVAGLAAAIERALARDGSRVADRIPVGVRPARPPLSFAQQRMWFMDQMVPGSAFFNVTEAIKLTGPLDADALRAALNGVVARHETLRTRYPSSGGLPYQAVAAAVSVPLPVVEVTDEEQARRFVMEQIAKPFDLADGPVLRAGLARWAPAEQVLWISIHHIAYDEWSSNVLLWELSALYTALTSGRPATLSPIPVQYADVAIWQRERIEEIRDRQLSYWRERLAGAPHALPLPTDLPRPKRLSRRGASLTVRLDPEVAAGLRNVAGAAGCTPYMVLLALFGVLLHRYGAGDDISIATPIANRTRQEIEALIGLFFNTLVLRLDLSGQPRFTELLRRTKEVALGAYDHQDLPFEQVVEALRPVRDLSRDPLAQVLFQLHGRRPGFGQLSLPGVTAEPFEFPWTTARADLEWHLREDETTFGGIVTYATDLFERDKVANMIEDFTALAGAVAGDPDCSPFTVPLAGADGPDERRAAGSPGEGTPEGAPGEGTPVRMDTTQTEAAMCEVWGAVLKLDKIEASDDFFDLGGQSLLAAQLIARIDDVFGVRLPLSELFERSTVGELAQAVAELRGDAAQGSRRPEVVREGDGC
ncbi:amino acid adenylation domain-containing protein [Nonomuraea angiospora]|uniref:amino acid adenylation domain-containing protein n=1 Tax=Nonomuraea angiospora TaxID=46172 RepID=UPI0037879445